MYVSDRHDQSLSVDRSKDGIVEQRPKLSDRDIVGVRMHAVAQQYDVYVAININPNRSTRKTEVADSTF